MERLGHVILLTALGLVSCFPRRTPAVFEIQEGFRGWVEIDFERPECPPLSTREGKLVFAIPGTGQLCTSSRFEEGWARDEYFLVGNQQRKVEATGWGKGGFIWAPAYTGKGDGTKKDRYYRFFVGTEADYNAAVGAVEKSSK